MTLNVGPGLETPRSHHISLTKGSDTMGLICAAGNGAIVPEIMVNPYPGMATQIRSNQTKHADRVAPFLDIPLDDFSGGMGMLHHDEDKSRYLDGYQVDTTIPGRVSIQGRGQYTTGLRDFQEFQPGYTSFRRMYWDNMVAGETVDWRFTGDCLDDTSWNVDSGLIYARKIGSPTGYINVRIMQSDDTVIAEASEDISDIPTESPYWFPVDLGASFAGEPGDARLIEQGDTYKIQVEIDSGATTDASNYVELWYYQYYGDPNGETKHFVYRFKDDTDPFDFKMFEYKNALYGVTVPEDGSVSKLYMLGDRGSADDNTGALTTTIDATKAWTADEWIGDVVLITGGSGLLEEQPWRTITDNDATTLAHTKWTFVHDTSTEYVILSDKWGLKQTLSARVHDTSVIGGKVFFAFGYPGAGVDTDLYMRRYREYNSTAGVWTEEISTEDNNYFGAEKILGIIGQDSSKWESTIADLYTGAVTPDGTFMGKFAIPYDSQDMHVPIYTLCENNRAWSDTIYTGSIPSTTYYGSVAVVGDAFVTGKCAHWKLPSAIDIRGGNAIAMRLNVDPAGSGTANYDDAGDIKFVIADGDGNEDEYNISGTTEQWVDEFVSLAAAGTANADMSNITDMYWKIENDEGAVNIGVWGSIMIVGDRGLLYKKWHSFENGEIIKNMIEYAGGGGETTMKPWIITDRDVYYIEDDIIKPIYLRELSEFRHPRNGEGVVVADVYLYFNLAERIQRYFAGQLDSVGPDMDYGLPANRRGIPASLAAYPGMVLAGYDAGDSGYSHVMYRRNHGWHELYRSPETGKRIKNIEVMARADTIDRLYISEGEDVLYVPVTLNSETETGFPYNYHAHIETSRIYGTLRETRKYFHSFKVIQEAHNVNTSGLYAGIRVSYRTSNLDGWTLIDDFTTVPNEENAIGAYDVGSTWIQFLIELETQNAQFSPVYVAGVLNAVERIVVKDTYTYNIVLFEGTDQTLSKGADDLTGSEKKALLDSWADQELPILLNSNSSFEDGTYVLVEPIRGRLISNETVAGKERRIYSLALLEV